MRLKKREQNRKKLAGKRSVCRLLQSHCTTLEFQTRTLGRAESRGEERESRHTEVAGQESEHQANTGGPQEELGEVVLNELS